MLSFACLGVCCPATTNQAAVSYSVICTNGLKAYCRIQDAKLLFCLQFITCCLMSMGYAARTVGVAGNCFATMLQIYNTKQVQGDAEIGWTLRLFGAAGIAVGILLGGWRLVPVSGLLLQPSNPSLPKQSDGCRAAGTAICHNPHWHVYSPVMVRFVLFRLQDSFHLSVVSFAFAYMCDTAFP